MGKFDLFWTTMDCCDWSEKGDDDLVLRTVIAYLSYQKDETIFAFDEQMSELLYALDTKKLAEQCASVYDDMSDDSFLYSRCVALINGPAYYEKAQSGECPEMWQMEFESLLYVPQRAWAKKHGTDENDYPYTPQFCYETGSNKQGWNP